MPLTRGQITIDTVTLEAEPFEWPLSLWEMLEIRITERTGWATLTRTVVDTLLTLYNDAHGQVVSGLKGLIVQYIVGTGSGPFVVEDWRGNTGSFVFAPDNGLKVQEVHGSGDEASPLTGGYWTGTIRLVKVG